MTVVKITGIVGLILLGAVHPPSLFLWVQLHPLLSRSCRWLHARLRKLANVLLDSFLCHWLMRKSSQIFCCAVILAPQLFTALGPATGAYDGPNVVIWFGESGGHSNWAQLEHSQSCGRRAL